MKKQSDREKVFSELSEINAHEKKISSQEVERICLESKQEMDARTERILSSNEDMRAHMSTY